jgi:hypothetical protein
MRQRIAWIMLVTACSGDSDDGVSDDGLGTGVEATFLAFTERESDAERRGVALSVALVHITGDWVLGDSLTVAPVLGTGNFGVVLPDGVPSSHVGSLPGGRRGAAYLPIVFDDVNRNEALEDGASDLYLGYSELQRLVWLDDDSGPSGPWAVLDLADDQPAYFGLNAQAAVQLWGLSSEPRLTGLLGPEVETRGVVAVDARVVDGGTPSNFVAWSDVAHPVTGRFEGHARIRPGFDTFQDGTPRFAHMTHVLFDDVDGDGAFTPDVDTLTDKGLCYDGERLDLRYVVTPTTFAGARELAQARITSGWRFLRTSGELNTSNLRWIPFGQGCDL